MIKAKPIISKSIWWTVPSVLCLCLYYKAGFLFCQHYFYIFFWFSKFNILSSIFLVFTKFILLLSEYSIFLKITTIWRGVQIVGMIFQTRSKTIIICHYDNGLNVNPTSFHFPDILYLLSSPQNPSNWFLELPTSRTQAFIWNFFCISFLPHNSTSFLLARSLALFVKLLFVTTIARSAL